MHVHDTGIRVAGEELKWPRAEPCVAGLAH
jgi:hypothetical protein